MTLLAVSQSSITSVCYFDSTYLLVIYINVLPPLDSKRLIRHILEQVERTAKCPFKYAIRLVQCYKH